MKHILPLLLVLSMSAGASAQGLPGVPGGGFPAFNAGQPGAAAINYQGVPPSFLPHPYLSPFQNASEQHVNDNGLWYSDTVSHFEERGLPFTYDVQVEWLKSSVRQRAGLISDEQAITQIQRQFFQRTNISSLTARFMFPADMSQIPNVHTNGLRLSTTIKSREGWRIGLNGIWNDMDTSEYNPRAQLEALRLHEADVLLLQMTGGSTNGAIPLNNLRNTTDREITESIILAGPIFDAADADDFGARGMTSDILTRTLIVLPTLSLNTGPNNPAAVNGLAAGLEGTTQFFDIDFITRRSIESYGAGAHFESNTLFERSGIQFRGLIGGRYLRINEGFHFRGTNSGLDYTITAGVEQTDRVDNNGDFIIDELGEASTGGGGGGGAGTGGAGGTTNSFTQLNPSNQILQRSFVDSNVKSDLRGPLFGFGYDIGRKAGIAITGSTQVGALFNRERLSLQGDNIGDTLTPNTLGTELEYMFDTSTTNGLTQNAFADRNGATHVSPMFEQNLTANLPLFSHVPVLRDMRVLEETTLQLGWTFLWIGEVADPQASIVWASNPRAGLFPTLNIQRDDYFQNTLRLGINCNY